MRFQARPEIEFKGTFEGIAKAKHLNSRNVLTRLNPTVLARATVYQQQLTILSGVATTPWPDGDKTALRSCYDSNTIPLGKLKNDLLTSLRQQSAMNLTVCPYCMVRPPSTWDHYLPQHWYPEFSVLPINLVYVCSDCNKTKLDNKDDINLLYVHPYFYPDPRAAILHCQAKVEAGRLALSFFCAPPVEAPLTASVEKLVDVGQRHVENLGLESAYQSEAGSIVGTFVAELRRDFANGIPEAILKDLILRRYQLVEVDHGPNAWEARLWAALYHFADLQTYINAEIFKPQRILRGGIEIPPPPPPANQ